ncbi:tail fiber domain-containing protein, partial [Hymenobacter convexus]|uniref:tail fiber domain-containing protein n=1 Tax=Hymenobacter sp. CA1UV-4 TaxID=3063782 RepID=UPI002713368A
TGADQAGGFRVAGNGYVAGNVGVGTSTPAGQLANTAANVLGTDGNGISSQGLGWVSTSAAGYAGVFYNANNNANAPGLAVKVASTGVAALDVSQGTAAGTAGTTLLRVNGNGNVGIGTTNPGQKLDVNGDTHVSNNATVDGNQVVGGALFVSGDSFLSGTVGIGTPFPNEALDVSGRVASRSGGFVFPDGTVQTTAAVTVPGDNLGNHTATRALNLQGNALIGTGASISGVGVGVRADGGLNLGQNGPGNGIYLGYQAGQANTTGNTNQFVGYQSGYANTSGYNNLFNGYRSGYANTRGYNNQFEGFQAGYSNTTGFTNQFSGYTSGYSNTAGNFNQFSGFESGYSNTTGSNNQFDGYDSGYSNTTGSNNQFDGYHSGYSNTTGTNNLFVGNVSGAGTTTGSNNVYVGYFAGSSNLTGSNNTVLGYNSGGGTALTNATALGANVTLAQSNTVVLGNGASVGIGTSTPTQKLDVDGGILARSNSAISNQGAYLQWNRSGGDGETWLLNQQGGSSSGGIRFGSATTANVATEWARFDGTGNLGLGATSPTQKLDVRGNLRLGADGGNSATGLGQAVEFVGPGFNTDPVGLYRVNPAADASELRVVVGDGADANDKFVVGRSSATGEGGIPGSTFTPSFTVQSNGDAAVSGQLAAGSATVGGNVGIGTSPAGGLHIDRPEIASITSLGVLIGGGSSGNPSIELRGNGKSPYLDFVENTGLDYSTRLISLSGTLNLNYGGTATKPTNIFNVGGGVQATAFNTASDQRFKTNVRPIGSALASVLALRGVRYDWNALGVRHGGTAGAPQVGLLAQEVEKIYPELVSTDKDGYKAVNYAQLTPVLIEALKEQQQQIEALKAQNAAAHTELQTVKAQAATDKAQATATLETFEARLRRLESAAGGQAQR